MALFNENALSGKRILVTGGGTGLGKAMATHLAGLGADVHLWGRRLEVLQAAADEINAQGKGRAYVQAVDIRKADLVDAARRNPILELACRLARSGKSTVR